MQLIHVIVLRCNLDGIVQEIVARSALSFPTVISGESFVRMISAGSVARALRFLQEVRAARTSAACKLNVMVEGGIRSLYFGGLRDGDSLIIGGAVDAVDEAVMRAELLRLASISDMQPEGLTAWQPVSAFDGRSGEGGILDELAALRRELQRKNRKLERLDSLKNEMLGMAVHDLRTPLSVITLYSNYLLEESELEISAEQAELVQEILRASEFMLKLVNNLLDLATIDAGNLQIDYQPVELAGLIEHNVYLNGMLAQRKGMRIELDLAPALPQVFVDPVKIEQVLNNLIANAVKFAPLDSTIFVKVRAGDDIVMVTVRDQGPGIPVEQQGALFRPFGRVSPRTPDGQKNSGLGLAISRRIVEGHGGRIWLESTAGAGASFTFTLPIVTDELLARLSVTVLDAGDA